MNFKRSHWLLRLHRYLGLFCCILFLMWFLSGIVMMYVHYPVLTSAERLAHLPLLQPEKVKVPPPSPDAVLGMLLNRPVYRSGTQVIYADNNGKMNGIDSVQALQIAGDFFGNKYAVRYASRITSQDQWLNKGSFVPLLPAYAIQLNDPAITTLYVSTVTGEVFHDVNRREKFLAWLGPIPHWIYLKILIIKPNRPIWSQLIIWTSLLGTIMCFSGIIAGIIRWKRKKISPYKKRWLKWHHYTGLVFGLFTFTWVLSGLFSMDPLNMGLRSAPRQKTGTISEMSAISFIQGKGVKEIRFTEVNNTPWLLAYTSSLQPLVISPDKGIIKNVPALALDSAVQATMPANTMQRTVVAAYDAYYYTRDSSKPLPVIRYAFNDKMATVVYADPVTGATLLRNNDSSRRLRWLYHGLHSFDFPRFHTSRPLWDITLLILLLGGTALSFTGIALTIKWMRRKLQ
jgi:uncharacterized iron-regulated membrane protein